MPPKRTIVEIAERVGVSPATVSRALNNQAGVGEDKRRRIMEVAAELDYHPNVIARSLQGQRTNTVAYMADVGGRSGSPDTDLFFFKDFIMELAASCARRGQDLLIHPARLEGGDLSRLDGALRSGRADGLVLADVCHSDPRVAYLQARGLPFVAFGRATPLEHPWVDVDGEAGVCAAVSHLIGRGHRRIAFLGLPEAFTCATERRAGYHRALAEHGLLPDPACEQPGLAGERGVAEALARLLALPSPPTAFAAASDTLAIHLMAAAAQRGLLAGRDYALTGFDGLPITGHTLPALTTVRQPLSPVCDALTDLLARVIAGQPGPRQILIQPELVVRASS